MDLNTAVEVMHWLEGVPTWGWVVLVIVILIIFGDRKCWEYEVKFSLVEGIGHGEVEIEAYTNKLSKKIKKHIEVDLDLEPGGQNKAYEVFLNGIEILSIPEEKTATDRVRIHEKYEGVEPHKGDVIKIKSNNEDIFVGKLHKD